MKLLRFSILLCFCTWVQFAMGGAWSEDFETVPAPDTFVWTFEGNGTFADMLSDEYNHTAAEGSTASLLIQNVQDHRSASKTTWDSSSSGPADVGFVSAWFYDIGVSNTSYQIGMDFSTALFAGTTTRVALGVHESVPNNYALNVGGLISDSGIPRQLGWHLIEVGCISGNYKLHLDDEPLPLGDIGDIGGAYRFIATSAPATVGGATTNENKVWIDDVEFHPGVPLPVSLSGFTLE